MKKLSFSLILILTVVFSVASFGCRPDDEVKPSLVARNDVGTLGYLFTEYEGYYYEDASVLVEENRVIISYTTNKTKDAKDSVIAVRTGKISADGWEFASDAVIAVEPSTDGWDKFNVGSSDIISGEFAYGDTTYKYMLAYHANDIESKKRMQVGLAVSNDLSNWIKVGKSPFISYDYEIYGDFDGVCNPSLVNVNGKANILLFYSYASERITETRFIEARLDNLNEPVVSGSISVPHQGLPMDGLEWANVINADFGYDNESGKVYIVKDGMVFAAQNAKKSTLVQLAEIPMTDLYKQTAVWTNIASVYAIEVGGYTRLHSAALVTDGSGGLVNGLSIVFTSSVAATDATDTTYVFKSGLHYYNVVEEKLK